MTRTVVDLRITSLLLSGDELEKLFDIDIFCSYNIGECRLTKKGTFLRKPEKENGIMINSNLCESENYEEHIKDILSQIKHIKEIFIQLDGKIDTMLRSCIYVEYSDEDYFEPPRFHLEKDVINELSSMNISLDYDSYIYKR